MKFLAFGHQHKGNSRSHLQEMQNSYSMMISQILKGLQLEINLEF